MADKFINLNNGITAIKTWVTGLLANKQDTLVSGTNIKTVNNNSLLGSGNIDISGGGGSFIAVPNSTTYAELLEAISEQKVIYVEATNGTDAAIKISQGSDRVNLLVAQEVSGEVLEFIYYKVTASGWVSTSLEYPGDWDFFDDVPTTGSVRWVTSDGIKTYVDTKVDGLENTAESIEINANGQLTVGGRLGQFPTTTGIYAPNNREPRMIADYSFLVTDALGMNMTGNRAFGVVSGYGLTCKSAAAGATEYRVTNNYANRILCKLAEGGYASRDEATSKAEQIVQVVSVTINGSSFTPDSSANSSTDIVIKTAQTLNPSSAITNIRLFGTMGAYASIHTGNGIKSESGGRNLLLGGGVTKSGSANDNCLVGNGIFSNGNGVAAFGRYHILRKNRGFFAGTGHDSTNAPSEGASAIGQYSFMDASTLFAVGNGSSHTDRKNAFEVRSDGIVLQSPNGTRYKVAVDNNGNLTITAV